MSNDENEVQPADEVAEPSGAEAQTDEEELAQEIAPPPAAELSDESPEETSPEVVKQSSTDMTSSSSSGGYRVLGQMIQGVDEADEIALLFAERAKEMAQTFVAKRRTAEALEAATATIERLEREVKQNKPALDALSGSLREAEAMSAHPPAALGLIGGAALIFLGSLVAGQLMIGLFVAAALGSGGGYLYKKATDERTNAINDAQSKLNALKAAQSSLEKEHSQAKTDQQSAQEKLSSLKPRKTVDVVGRAYYPLKSVKLAGYSLLLDRIGSHAKVELKIPDLVTDPTTVTRVNETVSRTSEMPTLLSPSSEAGNEVDSLHGRELELKDAVDDFTDMVHSIAVHNRKLPLIGATSELTELVSDDASVSPRDGLDGPIMSSADGEEMDEAISTISDVAKRLRDVGGEADSILRDSYSQLNTNLINYKTHRSHALDCLHSKFVDAMGRAALLSVNSYCPKCNRVPQWLYGKLGVSLEEAHLVDQRELLMRLNDDPEIAKRLDNDESLIRGLNASFRNLLVLTEQVPPDVGEDLNADDGVGANLSDYQAQMSRERALRGQLDVVLGEYRSVLRKILTGSSRPLLEVSHAARLYLDPVHGTWTCGACGAVYDDEHEVALGRLLKVKDNLMLPIWNHLWSEKEDFRKSELFRTNESLQRMSEKESEKLLGLAESYKSDMRPVRENLIRYSTEADTKNRQLSDTIQGLQDMGYMTDEKAKEVRARINKMMGGSIGEATASAEAKELLLALEPQAQLNRRPPAADPINMLLSPERLFLENELLEHPATLIAPESEAEQHLTTESLAGLEEQQEALIQDGMTEQVLEPLGGEHV